MDRRRMNGAEENLRRLAEKYKYAIATVLLGVLLMLLPSGKKTARYAPEAQTAGSATVQSEMEAALAAFDGVGRLRLMLTVAPGTENWEGAVVVCEGADSAAVRLELTQAVRALTGLSSEHITIVKGKP